MRVWAKTNNLQQSNAFLRRFVAQSVSIPIPLLKKSSNLVCANPMTQHGRGRVGACPPVPTRGYVTIHQATKTIVTLKHRRCLVSTIPLSFFRYRFAVPVSRCCFRHRCRCRCRCVYFSVYGCNRTEFYRTTEFYNGRTAKRQRNGGNRALYSNTFRFSRRAFSVSCDTSRFSSCRSELSNVSSRR